VPRLVEALVGKRVIGAAAGGFQTAVWTEEGELFTLVRENMGSWATEGMRMSMC
jgi:hypothetical protein